jgi:hypothetical protein
MSKSKKSPDRQGEDRIGPLKPDEGTESVLSDKSQGSPQAEPTRTVEPAPRAPAHAREEVESTGKIPNTNPKTDPIKIALQARVFDLRVTKRWSLSNIGNELGITRNTAASYLHLEWERNRLASETDIAMERTFSIQFYEYVREKYMARMDQPGAKGDEGRYAMQAQERIDKLKGLDAPMKIEQVNAPPVPVAPSEACAILLEIARRRTEYSGGK